MSVGAQKGGRICDPLRCRAASACPREDYEELELELLALRA